jgi:hypothetical protein
VVPAAARSHLGHHGTHVRAADACPTPTTVRRICNYEERRAYAHHT